MDISKILSDAVAKNASDIFIVAGRALSYTVEGNIISADSGKLKPSDTYEILSGIYSLLPNRTMDKLEQEGNDDFSFALAGISRFRVSAYRQRNSFAAVVRVISFTLPNPREIGIPESVLSLSEKKKGLVLITGTAGSGKSTTLACIIDRINSSQNKHIITLEDPLEFLHSHKKSIVSQREIGTDVKDYLSALRASLRQRPNVILLGEMRDYETIDVAMTAAETGHLIFSSLHTVGAANTIERIIDVFPPNQQQQIAFQLAMVLQAVASQQLVPTLDGRLVPVFEIMTVTPAIRNLIRENKIHQVDNVISSAQSSEMISMDNALLELYKQGIISDKTALTYCANPEMLAKKL
ncbi:MAG: PilT/PilU family type 4a pilus ATPase [Oscillospiraceae bacterium]